MRVEKTKKGVEIEFFADCKELTAERDNELYKLAILQSGVGSNMEAIGNHFSRLHELIKLGENEAAAQEAVNLHNNMYLAIEKMDIDCLSLAVFVNRIGRDYRNDLTENGIKETSNRLLKTGITKEQVEDILSDLKKKLLATFNRSFLIDLDDPSGLILSTL